MKIVSIVGARPQFIKLAPLSRHLRKRHSEVIIHTGQHYDYGMSEVFFNELSLPPADINLGIGSGTHGAQTARMLEALETTLVEISPDMVMVFGDTNSTLAGALAASKLGMPIAHIEAGMRSFDRTMPEEINRVLTDHCSDILLCSTETAAMNLKNEGITKNVHVVGDLMYDALLENIKIARSHSTILPKLGVQPKSYILSTLHRQSSTDEKNQLAIILRALSSCGEKVVLPLHPRTRKMISEFGLQRDIGTNLKLIEPVGYLDMLILQENAKKIVTDSGGIQKEAYLLGIPCITLRSTTEWVETVAAGWNILPLLTTKSIIQAIAEFSPKGRRKMLFGDGHASHKIAKKISVFKKKR